MTDKPRIRVQPGYRLDAWANAVSGMGMPGSDKSIYTKFGFYNNRIDWATLSKMYRYDWLTRKICDRPALDAVRRWINIEDQAIKNELERIGAKKKFKQAIAWSRLYGGAAVLIIADDGLSAADPLDPARVKRIVELRVIDRHHLTPQSSIQNVYDIGYGEPEFYTTNSGTIFHHTRVLKFTGADLTQDEAEIEQYWGGSYIEVYKTAVEDFQGVIRDVRHIINESSIGELKIPGLTNSVAMGGQIFNVIQKRLDNFNLSKSVFRTAAMDAEETFDFKNRQLTGLADLLDRFMTTVAGATGMGELVLFGTTPSGLNASQDEQMSVYFDLVRSIQEEDLMPATNTVIACINKGVVPEWDYVPLMEPSDETKSRVRLAEAQALSTIADVTMITPDDAVTHLNSTGFFALPVTGIENNGFDGVE